MNLSERQRKYLRGLAHPLEPVILVGNAGLLATRVEYVKRTGKKNFVIVDAAMNDLIRDRKSVV